MLEEVERLTALAEAALALHDSTDQFIEQVDAYILALEEWSGSAAEQTFPPEMKPPLEKLNELHTQLLTRASLLSKQLGSELGNANKKGRVLRAYVDRLPQRITITGRRKG
ncbi:MAG: hypothetical protein U0136_11580 [Bdellovibrionota bacterium]